MISVTILGNNSASPAHGRHPTAQIVQIQDQTFLVDCGEGTQMQLNRYKVKWSKVSRIFISHLHGDHFFGLIGLLNSYGLNHRDTELHIYSPEGLQEIIELQIKAAEATLPFTMHFHVLKTEGLLYEDDRVSISTFKVNHRIPCFGFIFKEVRNPRKIDIEKVEENHVPRSFYNQLHQGEDYVTEKGITIPNEQLTVPGKPERSYAFCADTAYFEPICNHIKNVDMIYHETTYLAEQNERAALRFHSTTIQAAKIAKMANVHKLLIGHYSSMYDDTGVFEEEAREVFENTEATREGVTYLIKD